MKRLWVPGLLIMLACGESPTQPPSTPLTLTRSLTSTRIGTASYTCDFVFTVTMSDAGTAMSYAFKKDGADFGSGIFYGQFKKTWRQTFDVINGGSINIAATVSAAGGFHHTWAHGAYCDSSTPRS